MEGIIACGVPPLVGCRTVPQHTAGAERVGKPGTENTSMAAESSTYLFIFRETAPERYEALSREERMQALARWNAWCDGLAAQGRLKSGHTLQPEGRVVAGKGTTDGPFAEAKEVVGGYLLVEAASLDEATAIAEQCPNLPYGMVVEVRPIGQACHLARSLGWTTMRGPAERQPA